MKKLWNFLKYLILILLAPPLLFLLLVIIGGAIPVNKVSEGKTGEIEIFLVQNGYHTDLVLPVNNRITNWEDYIKPNHFPEKSINSKYYSFGWGDLEFYRKTPQWEDLTLKTGVKALFLATPSAVHVTALQQIHSEKVIALKVTSTQYKKISTYIISHFEVSGKEPLQPLDFHYAENDVFYRSKTNFHAFRTCNSWINEALKFAKLRACFWTPFAQPLFYQYS